MLQGQSLAGQSLSLVCSKESMKYLPPFSFNRPGALILGLAAFCQMAQPVRSATFYWDPDGTSAGNVIDGTNLGGSGVWTTAQPTWWDLATTGLWPNNLTDEAVFTGAAGGGAPLLQTVTLGSDLVAGKLSFMRSGYTLASGDLALAGAGAGIFVSRGNYATLESQLSGTDGLSLTGGGGLRLSNPMNHYTGLTSISNGILVIGSQAALGTDPSAVVVNGSATRGFGGGTLLLDGEYDQGMEFTRDLVLQGLGPITDRNAALISIGNNTLSGAVTYAGGNVVTAINSVAGMLTLSGTVTSLGTSALLRFGTVNSVGVGGYHVTGGLFNPSTGGLEKIGGGTLILESADILLNGTVNVAAGSVRVANGAALGTSTANGALTLGGGTGILEVRTNAPGSFDTRRVTMGTSGNGTIYLDHAVGAQVLNQTVALSALTLTAGGTTRTLVIDGRNGHGLTFAGDSVGGALGGSNSITVNANGLVTFDGSFWNNTATTARTLTFSAGTGAQAVITGSVVASGAAHVLTKTGAGTLTILGNDSTYTGATNVSAGVLAISSFGSINNDTGVVNIGSTTTAATLNIVGENLNAGQTTTSKVINLAGTTGGATLLANQTGTSPGLVFNASFTATGAGAKTLTLGGANTADNTIKGVIGDSTAATTLIKTGAGTWVLAGANTYTGMTILTEGTLKIQASLAGTSILADAAAVGLKFGSTAAGSAGGIFHYVGADGVASTETIGTLLPGGGAGTVRVTPGAGGTASVTFASLAQTSPATMTAAASATTTLTVSSTAGLEPGMRLLNGSAAAYVVSIASATSVVVSANQTLSSGTVLNFGPGNSTVNYVPEAGGSVVFASVAEVGLLSSSSYFKGADFAYAPATVNAVLRAPVYGTDAGFVTAGATLVAGSHNLVTGNTSTAAATLLSLKIDGTASPTLTQTGLLTIRTGAAGTAGGILVTGGSATIAGTGVTTGGAGDLFIRVDGASDTLFLNAPVTATTTGGLIKTGEGTLVIGAANAQTTGGITQLQEGTIKLAPGGRLSANSVHLYMRQGTTFDLNGVSVAQTATTTSIGLLSGMGTVTNTSATPVVFAVAGSGGVFNGTINEVNGRISVVKMGTNTTQVFNGLSNYTGSTTIGVPGSGTSGTLSAFYLADIGKDSSIGRGDDTDTDSNAASLIFGGTTGGLVYIGDTSVSTDRLFTLAGTAAGAGATITNNGVNNAALIFSNPNAIAFNSTADQMLRLGGTSLADNWFNPRIRDNGTAITSLTKVNAGLWILGNTGNDYTGATTITEGALQAQDKSTLPEASGLVLGGGANTQQSVFQSSGVFERDLGTGANSVSWGTTLTTGGSGFAASTSKFVVAIGGAGTETQLVWNSGSFLPAGTGAGAALVLNSTTALAEVELRNPIDLNGANRVIVVNDNTSTFTDYATITGAISDSSGTGGITKSGNGTLQLRGANTYRGATAVTAGTLIITSLGHSTDAAATPTSLGASGVAFDASNALTLGNGGTTAGILQYVGGGEVSDRLVRLNTTTGNTQIHADGSGPLILTNLLNNMAAGAKSLYLRGSNAMGNMIASNLADNGGALAVVVDGGATWILSGNNTHTGTNTISAGALGIGSDTAAGTGTLSLSSASVFAYGGDRTLTNPVTLNTNTGVAFIGEHSLTLAPTDGVFTLTGTTSSLTFTATNNIAPDKTLTLDGDLTSAATAARTWAINGSGNTVFTGDILSTGAATVALSYTGNGTLSLGGTNTTGGNTTINNAAGRVIIANDNAFGSGALVLTAGGLESAGGDRVISNNVTHGGTFIIGGTDKFTFNGTWLNNAGNRTLTVNTAGGLELTGQVTLSEHATTARTLTINGTGDVLISGAITNGTGTGASALAYTGSGTLTITNGANTYTGTTTLNNANGTLRVTGAGKLSAGNLTVNAGSLFIESVDHAVATLTMGNVAGTSATINVASGLTLSPTAITFAGTTTLTSTITGAGTLALGAAGITVTVADNIAQEVDMLWTIENLTGSGLFTKAGTGVLDFSGVANNGFTGNFQINAGAVMGLDALGANLALNGGVYQGAGTFTRGLGTGSNEVQWLALGGGFAAAGGDLAVTLSGVPSPLVWGGTASFVPDAAPLLFGSTSADAVTTFTHDIDLNGATRTISAVDNTAVTTDWAELAGVLSNGAITKTGNGTLRLGGASTFTGDITISAGTLQFSTVSNNGGGPSNLGQGTNGIILGGGTLSFVGDGAANSQSTNRALTLTASSTLHAGGTNGASITYSGPISAGTLQLQLTGSPTSLGFLTGGVTHTSTGPDLLVSSGNWTVSNTPLIIGDEVKVNGVGTVLNLNTTGVLTYFTGTSNFIYIGNGGTVNLGADDVSSAALGLEGILPGFETAGEVATFNVNTFNISTPRLDVGQIGPGLEGNVIGSGTVTVTVTTAGSGLNLYRGSVSANLAGAGALFKAGMGDVVLSGNNSGLTGTTRLDAGNLILDYTSSNTAKLNAATALDMRGATLTLNGSSSAATSMSVAGFTMGSGGSNQIRVNGGAGQDIVLNLGEVTRASGAQDGTVRFFLPSGTQSTTHGITTATLNGPHGLLGSSGFATVRDATGTWFATNAAGLAGGNIIGLVSSIKNDVTTWLAGDHVTDAGTGFTGTLLSSAGINSLRFDAASGGMLGMTPGGILTIASGGILVTDNVVSGTPGIFGGVLASGALELIVTQDSAQIFEIASSIPVNHAVTKTGAGTLRLSGTNFYTDETELQEGTLQLAGGNAIGDSSLVTLADDHFSTLQLLASETIGRLAGGSASAGLDTLALVDLGSYDLTLRQVAASTYSGRLSGGGRLIKGGASTLTLGGSSADFTGDLIINQGQVTLATRTVANLPNVGSVTLNSGVLVLDFTAGSESANKINNTASITLINTGGTDGLRANNDRNDGSKTETVGDMTFLGGANTITLQANAAVGTTARVVGITAATVTRSNHATLLVRGNNLGNLGTSGLVNSGRLVFTTAPALTGGGGAADTTSISILPWAIADATATSGTAHGNGASFGTYVATTGFRPLNLTSEYEQLVAAGGVTAASNVRYSGSASLTLDGTAKAMNALLVDNASGSAAITLSGAGGALNVNSGAFLFTGTQGITLADFSGVTTGILNEYLFHVVNSSTEGVTLAAPLTSPTAALTKSGAGTLILTSTGNTYAGVTTINQGALQIDAMNKLGAAGAGGITLNGGTLRFGGVFDPTSVAVTLGIPATQTVQTTTGGTFDTNGFDITLAGSLGNGGNGGFTKTGDGVLTLNAPVTYTGITTINLGTLAYGVADALPTNMNVTLAGGTLDVGAFASTLADLDLTVNSTIAGGAPLTFMGNVRVDGGGSRTLTVNNAGLTTFSGGVFHLVSTGTSARTTTINGTGDVLISSEITNDAAAGSLTYSGSGTLTLTGLLSYTGLTTLNNTAGTLVFSGASQLAGTALTVNAGTARLNPAFDETVGNLTLGGGGAGTSATLQIGAGRTLTLAGTVTFSSTGSPLAATIDGGAGSILDFGGLARTFNVADSANAEPDLIIGANVTLVNDGGGGIIKQGAGTLHIAGTNQLTGPVVIQAGAVTGNLGTGNLSLNNGVFEGSGTFTRSLGAGGGQVQWAAGASGGFAASGGALTVTLAGAPDPLVWDGTPFFVSGAGALLLGSTTADSVVTFTHNINLNATASPVTRTITVNDNADVTTDKAVLPGVLGSTGAGAVTVLKNGSGILELAGANTFSALTLSSGTLQFSTVTNIGGGPSNLGQGAAINVTGSSVLSFIGATSQSTDRPVAATTSFTLDASGSAGTIITYAGAITQADNATLTLSGNGVGAGSITGGLTQPAGAASADLIVTSGNWTLGGADSRIADDLLVNGGTLNLENGITRVNDDTVVTGTTAVLNLNSAGVLQAVTVSGTSSGLYVRTGGTINLNADNVNGVGNSGGLDFIYVGDSGGPDVAVFNTNTFSISVPRLDLGQRGAGLEGVIAGTGLIDVTAGDINLYTGVVHANLGSSGTAALEKFGIGTVVLKGDNSGLAATGNTILYEGTLVLDYAVNNATKVRTASVLELLGGDLVLLGNAGAATSQSVASTTLDGSATADNSGASSIRLVAGAGQDIVLNLGAIGRGATNRDGTIRFILPAGTQSATHGFVTSTVNGAQGLLGTNGFATVEDGTGTWFATNSTNAAGGNVVALVSTIANDVTAWAGSAHITDDAAGFTGALQRIVINSLRFNAAAGSDLTIAPGGVLGIASGGILVTDQVGGTPGIRGGTLLSGVNELIITQDSAQVFEISADIRLGHSLTKTGAGTLRLSGNNTYADETDIQAGTLQVAGGNAIGDNSIVSLNIYRNTTLELLADETIGRLAGGQRATNSDNGTVAVGTHTLTINEHGSTTYAGFFTGTGNIVVRGVSNLTLTNLSSGFTGTVTVDEGSLVLNNIGQINASLIRILKDGSLLIDNNGTTRSGTRILDTTPVTLESADGGFSGQSTVRGLAIRTDQGATTNERVGDLTFASGANYLSGETTNSSGTAVASLLANDFIRSNNATVAVRGRSLGLTSGSRNQFLIGTAANESAFISTLVGGGGAAGATNISIVPWAVGETTSGALAAANMGNSLVTYVAGAGFRPLLTTEYSTFAAAAATDNVRESLSTDLTGLAGGTINALVLNNVATAGLAVAGSGAGQTLNVTSGAMLFTLTGAAANTPYGTTLGGFDTGITVGAAHEYVISVINPNSSNNLTTGSTTIGSSLVTVASTAGLLPGMPVFGAGIPTGATVVSVTDETRFVMSLPSTLSASSQTYQYATIESLTAVISSPLTSSADLTKSGRGTLILSGTNTAGGGTYKTTLNEGTLEISGLDNIGGSTGGLVFAGGTLRLSAGYGGDDISLRTITFLAGGGTIDTNGIDLGLARSVGSGVGGLTKTGAGTLTLNAAATYTGPTTIYGGTLTLGADNATGSGGDLNIGGGATLDIGNHSITAAAVNTFGEGPALLGAGTITASTGFFFNNTGDITVNAILAGGGGLLKTQAGMLTLSGLSTFSGRVEVQGGTLVFDSITNVGGGASALGGAADAQEGVIRMGFGTAATTLRYTGAGSSSDRSIGMQGTTGAVTLEASGTGALALGGVRLETSGNKTLTLRGTSAALLNNSLGPIDDTGLGVLTLLKTDTNTWEFNGSNTYTGATSVDNGILRINAVQNLTGALNFGSVNSITTAGTVEVRQDATFGALTVQTNSAVNTSSLVVDAGKTITFTGNVAIGTGTGSLSTTLFTATGGGSLVVNNQASSGTFRVGGSSGSGNVTQADLSGLESLSVSLNTTNGVFRVNSTTGTNVNSTYSSLVLAENTTVTASVLAVGDGGQYNGAVGQINQLMLGAGVTNFNVDTLNIGTGSRDLGSLTFYGPSGTLTVRAADGVGAAVFNMGAGSSTTAAALPAGNLNTFNVAGHTADLLFGAMSIGTQNTRTGSMETLFAFDTGTLVADSLTMGSKTAAGGSLNTMNLGGGIVTIRGGASTAATLATNTNSGAVNSSIYITDGTVTIGSGSGAALHLGANNTHASGSATGTFTVVGGTVTLATTGPTAATLATGSAGTAAGVITAAGGTLTVQGDIVRGIGAATRNAFVVLGGGLLDMTGHSIGASGNAVELSAQAGTLAGLAELNGGGVLDKTGSDTLTLTDGNTYTGGTTISEGALLAMNTTGSATGSGTVTVLTYGILGGTGSVAGDVLITGGGVLTAGGGAGASGSAGQLTLGGTLTLDIASILRSELGGATTNDAAAVAAEMNANGNLSGLTIQASYENYQPGVTLHDSIFVGGSSTPVIEGTVQLAALGGYVPQYGDIFDLLDWAGVGDLSAVPNFDFSGISLGAGLGFNTDLFASHGIIVVVPEPSRAMLVMCGLLGLLSRRRRSVPARGQAA